MKYRLCFYLFLIFSSLFVDANELNLFNFSKTSLEAIKQIKEHAKIATFSRLEKMDDEGKFAILPLTLKPNRSYIWLVADEKEQSFRHVCPFQTNEEGKIVQSFFLEPCSMLVHQGERFISSIYDLTEKNYTLDFITPIPSEFSFRSGGKVKVQAKFPFEIYHFEFTGRSAFEQIQFHFNREERITMDQNGNGSVDIWSYAKRIDESSPIHIQMSDEEIDLFLKNESVCADIQIVIRDE